MLPDRAKSLWSVYLPPEGKEPELLRANLETGDWTHLANLLTGKAEGYQLLP